MAYIFAALLIWTGWRMFRHRHDSEGETAFVEKLKVRLSGRVGVAALAALVIADIVFAIDSVPSILAITDDPFIVFAANAFALLGLAPLFFLVADLVERLYYLKTALAALLILIGIKMAAGELWGKLGPEISLPAIAAVLGTGVVASLCATGGSSATASLRPHRSVRSGGERSAGHLEDDRPVAVHQHAVLAVPAPPRARARCARCRAPSRAQRRRRVSRWMTRTTSCSMIGPASSSSVT